MGIARRQKQLPGAVGFGQFRAGWNGGGGGGRWAHRITLAWAADSGCSSFAMWGAAGAAGAAVGAAGADVGASPSRRMGGIFSRAAPAAPFALAAAGAAEAAGAPVSALFLCVAAEVGGGLTELAAGFRGPLESLGFICSSERMAP